MAPATDRDRKLYDRVVDVTTAYLGPAAEQFITRQIRAHLHKEPDQLTKKDLKELAEWIKIAIALLTEDSNTVKAFTQSILDLADVKAK